jgi:hypothetical protein
MVTITQGKLVITVEENKTVMTTTAEGLRMSGVVRARNYLEAAGLLAAHKVRLNALMLSPHTLHVHQAGIFSEALSSNVRKIPIRQLRFNGV